MTLAQTRQDLDALLVELRIEHDIRSPVAAWIAARVAAAITSERDRNAGIADAIALKYADTPRRAAVAVEIATLIRVGG